MRDSMLIESMELMQRPQAIIVDCRFSLADAREGQRLYQQGRIPGAHYLDLATDLSASVGPHGGRHPLPAPADFAGRLAALGIGPDSEVIAYDDSRFAFAARFWWLLRSIGYRPPRLLNGGYQGFLAAGGEPETGPLPQPPAAGSSPINFRGYCDIDGLRQAQESGAVVVDSREERRYQGLEEPIDPVAGHIPGAINRPWQAVTGGDGRVVDETSLRAHWGDALEAEQLVVYCGSGVTACVNLFSLALLGRDDATLYAGSWSDWCSHLQP